MKPLAALLVCVVLAGCYLSNGPLYRGFPSITPFRPGILTARNARGETSHAVLTLERGQYRLTNDDRGTSDFGDAMTIRFFPLLGAPSDTLAFEAEDVCRPVKGDCNKALVTTSYHGLARVTPRGAEVISPDCSKASIPGITDNSYGSCNLDRKSVV